jgi:uncharacterized protein (TIGR03067 family)
MRGTWLAAGVALVCTAALAQQADPGKLEGVWETVGKLDAKGKYKPLQKDDPDYHLLRIKGDRLTMLILVNGVATPTQRQTIRIDSAKKPMHIDLSGTTNGANDAPPMRYTQLGIYSIEGDQLTLAQGAIERPKDFAKAPLVYHYRRIN